MRSRKVKQKDRFMAMKLTCGIERKLRTEVKSVCNVCEWEKSRNPLALCVSTSLHVGGVWHFNVFNVWNYHSGRVPTLGYNFIFRLHCFYPRAPQFIYAAQAHWIINNGCEQTDDEWHKCSIIQTHVVIHRVRRQLCFTHTFIPILFYYCNFHLSSPYSFIFFLSWECS